jgi:hypothetical protein
LRIKELWRNPVHNFVKLPEGWEKDSGKGEKSVYARAGAGLERYEGGKLESLKVKRLEG